MDLALIYTYYDSAELYRKHLAEWDKYSGVSVFVVDDNSKRFPLFEEKVPENVDFHRYYVMQRFKGQGGRNIGAYKARNFKWLMFSDIDHILTSENLNLLIEMLPGLDKECVYTFTRVMETGETKSPHGFTFLMTSELFWKIGGYDERLSGLYHGTCGAYKMRLREKAELRQLDIPLIYMEHESSKKLHSEKYDRKKVNWIIKNGEPLVLSREYVEI